MDGDETIDMKRPIRELLILSTFVLSFPFIAYVSTLPPQRFRNEITEWGDPNSQAYREFSEYRQKFGVNEFVVVSWPDCDLDDPRVEVVAKKIEAELPGFVERVSSGQRIYWDLLDRARLSEAAALKRLRNSFISQSGNQTAIGFSLSPTARKNRDEVISRLETILESSDVDPQQASYAGLGHNLYTLDKEGLESPFRMVPQIVLLAFLLTVLLTRNIGLAAFINALGICMGCLAFNFVYLADIDINAIIWPLPTLTMLLTVSVSLHFLSYFRIAVESVRSGLDEYTEQATATDERLPLSARREIASLALQKAIKPTLCCMLTTAMGLLSLLLSSSRPVRQFGLFGAISIVAASVLLLIWFPAFLTLIGYANKCRLSDSTESLQRDGWSWLASFTAKFRWPIIGCCIAMIVWCGFGVPKIITGSDIENFLPRGHRELIDAMAIEKVTGPLNSVELVLHFDNVREENDRRKVQEIAALSNRIVNETMFSARVSTATFSPVLNSRSGLLQRTLEKTRLKVLKERMMEIGLLFVDEQAAKQSWRISCRYSTLENPNLTKLNAHLKSLVQQQFFKDGSLIYEGENLETTTTGEFVLFDHIDRQFIRELLVTYVSAFAAISLVVLLVLRTKAWFVALLPNIFPAVVVLGFAGHLGFSLDVASLMTASVALGIAVDDTLHFLLWYRESAQSNSDDPAQKSTTDAVAVQAVEFSAIESTMRYCGRAMLQTSLILGGSIVLYGLCGFLPTVRFGLLLSAMMFAALIGDLILLPALLQTNRATSHQNRT